MTNAERQLLNSLAAKVAALERTRPQGTGVSTRTDAPTVRTTQLGFAAELTGTYGSGGDGTGYPWKRLHLDTTIPQLVNPEIQQTGLYAFTPDEDRSLASGTRGWMEISPEADGWLFLVEGRDFFWVRISGGSDAAGYSGLRVVLTAANTWSTAAPTMSFGGNLWRAPSNEVLPNLPAIPVDQVVLARPSVTFPPVAGVTQYEIPAHGGQKSRTFTFMGTDCKAYTLTDYARDLVGTVTAVSPPPPPPPPITTIRGTLLGTPLPHGPYPPGLLAKLSVVNVSGGTPGYTFNFASGDGATYATGASQETGHTYTKIGSWFPSVTIEDSKGNFSGSISMTNGSGTGRYDIEASAEIIRQRSTAFLVDQFDSSSGTTPAPVPGLYHYVAGASYYQGEARLSLATDAAGGWKVSIDSPDGTATASKFRLRTVKDDDTSRLNTGGATEITALGGTLDGQGASDVSVIIRFQMLTDDPGYIGVFFSRKNASGTSSVRDLSSFTMEPMATPPYFGAIDWYAAGSYTFDVAGTYYVPVPPDFAFTLSVETVAGGGGGAGREAATSTGGGGGGGGGQTLDTFSSPAGHVLKIIVGAGGTGGLDTGTDGAAGGDSSAEDPTAVELFDAAGGAGGSGTTGGAGGAGDDNNGSNGSNNSTSTGGAGGDCGGGAGTPGAGGASTVDGAAGVTGAGGGGGGADATAGGAGGDGFVTLTWS